MDPPDVFEIIDSNYVEMPKGRRSTVSLHGLLCQNDLLSFIVSFIFSLLQSIVKEFIKKFWVINMMVLR